MQFNAKNASIYIGVKAGAAVLHDLKHAKSSVCIVSPYLNQDFVKELTNLNAQNVEIRLLTTDEQLDYEVFSHIVKPTPYSQLQHKLYQYKKNVYRWLSTLFGLVLLLSVAYWVYPDRPKSDNMALIYVAAGSLSAVFLGQYLRKKVKMPKREYDTIFDLKVFLSPYRKQYNHTSNQSLIHAKIYIIDSKVAYIGSLNFTKQGFGNNYETAIQIKDPDAILAIEEEFENLYWSKSFEILDVNALGKDIYFNF